MPLPFTAPGASARITGDGVHPNLRGIVTFFPRQGGTLVVADISGLPTSGPGFFGFHIHSGNDCTGEGFPNTGNHWNPAGLPHPQHAGDLPPLLGADGRAYLAVLTNRFSISDILGKTVIIHSQPDDFKTQPSGDAGEKIACGVIRRNQNLL